MEIIWAFAIMNFRYDAGEMNYGLSLWRAFDRFIRVKIND